MLYYPCVLRRNKVHPNTDILGSNIRGFCVFAVDNLRHDNLRHLRDIPHVFTVFAAIILYLMSHKHNSSKTDPPQAKHKAARCTYSTTLYVCKKTSSMIREHDQLPVCVL